MNSGSFTCPPLYLKKGYKYLIDNFEKFLFKNYLIFEHKYLIFSPKYLIIIQILKIILKKNEK